MKPHRVGIHEARAAFSKLVEKAEAGQETIVTRNHKPVAKIVPYAPAAVKRRPGLLAGRVTIKDGFDRPVPGFEVFATRESGV